MQGQPEERIPVIVGVGETVDWPKYAIDGVEPLRLMEAAARAAQNDAGADLLRNVHSIDVVCEISWPYPDAPARLAEILGIHPARAVYGPIGGESPIRFIHEAALRIANGSSTVALIAGAEAEYTVGLARKQGIDLPWETRDTRPIIRGKDYIHRQAVLHGVATPATAYPLFENAATATWGQTPSEAHQESAALWERLSAVAADNPTAWIRKPLMAAEIGTPSSANRMIAFPYPKYMVANPMVNQAAAVIVCSLAHARAAGVAEEKMIYFYSGAAANESRDYLDRAELDRSHAQTAVLDAIVEHLGGDASVLAAAELYSCFPIVPKSALRILKAEKLTPTVTGGMSFFGAPLNNYMTHAAAAMVRRLRQQSGAYGLLYGNGGFMTYHHALILSSDRYKANGRLTPQYSVQQEADGRQLQTPRILDSYTGPAKIETFTVLYARDGKADFGTVLARTPNNERIFARVQAEDAGGIERLRDPVSSPVGLSGTVLPSSDGILVWQF
jgi:acetyl-CoA C-acetyltransferase